jgi:hypothetical protein
MARRKSVKCCDAQSPNGGHARSDLLHHVDAISLALKNWNDTEALRLLRLHWRAIADALRGPDLAEGISITVPRQNVQPSAESQFDEIVDRSAQDNGRTSTPPLRTYP